MIKFGDGRLPLRFWDKLTVNSYDCWIWTAFNNNSGYGVYKWERSSLLAHRVAYSVLIGDIPKGLDLDHLCRVRNCVNPNHLEPVTHAENMHRGSRASKSHCPAGHPYFGDNLYRHDGRRHCKECHNSLARDRYRKRRELLTKEGRYG